MTDPAQNEALIRQFYDEVFNSGNVDFAQQVHGPGYRYHDITVSDRPVDHDTYMVRNAGFAAAFPNRRVDIEDLIAIGDRVVARAIIARRTRVRLATSRPLDGGCVWPP